MLNIKIDDNTGVGIEMKYQKLDTLLKRFVKEKKMERPEAEKIERELEKILDEQIQKVVQENGSERHPLS